MPMPMLHVRDYVACAYAYAQGISMLHEHTAWTSCMNIDNVTDMNTDMGTDIDMDMDADIDKDMEVDFFPIFGNPLSEAPQTLENQ